MNPDFPVPFPHSYWVIPGLFLAGEYPGAKNQEEARQKLENLYHRRHPAYHQPDGTG